MVAQYSNSSQEWVTRILLIDLAVPMFLFYSNYVGVVW